MSELLTDILDRLDAIAAYDGPWQTLKAETSLLGTRLTELREREARLDDLLVIALVGGSGVGKSTLLNALAGDELAETSEFRPCTSAPTVYHPPGARLEFPVNWRRVSGSALDALVIVDTPDSDSIVREHRDIVVDVLRQCDLIVVCGDGEKYLDEATWSLLRPLRGERSVVCVETKASRADSVRAHWIERLEAQKIDVAGYFRVNSLRSFDRTIAGGEPGGDEYDFPALENFLENELTRERIQRMKRSNAAGLLTKTVSALASKVGAHRDELNELEKELDEADDAMARAAFALVRQQLFAEPHLWAFALGRELNLRAKGLVGTLFRLVESARTLPTRVAAWSPLPGRARAGHRAASIMNNKETLGEGLDLVSPELDRTYAHKRSAVAMRMAEHGFDVSEQEEGYSEFYAGLNAKVGEVLGGSARARLVSRAKTLTSWPVALLCDASPLACLSVSGYIVVKKFFSGELLTASNFLHAFIVLLIILGVELFVLFVSARVAAWSVRRAACNDLRKAFSEGLIAFPHDRRSVRVAREAVTVIINLRSAAHAGDVPHRPE